jgi:flagellin-specific chaperone FliS
MLHLSTLSIKKGILSFVLENNFGKNVNKCICKLYKFFIHQGQEGKAKQDTDKCAPLEKQLVCKYEGNVHEEN